MRVAIDAGQLHGLDRLATVFVRRMEVFGVWGDEVATSARETFGRAGASCRRVNRAD